MPGPPHPTIRRALRARLRRVAAEVDAGRWSSAYRHARGLIPWTVGTPAEGSTRRLVALLHRRAVGVPRYVPSWFLPAYGEPRDDERTGTDG